MERISTPTTVPSGVMKNEFSPASLFRTDLPKGDWTDLLATESSGRRSVSLPEASLNLSVSVSSALYIR